MSYQEQGGGSESVVVNGAVEGVEIKPNGRFVVKVREIGSTSQYSLNLNTKEQGLAQQMMNAIGQQFSFVCGLSHWTNQNGQPVTSKWINGVAPLQGQPQFQGQPQPPQPQQAWSQPSQTAMPPTFTPVQPQQQAPAPPPQPQTDDAFIRRVSWLAAIGPAVDALAYLPEAERTVPALVKMADFLARTAILRGQRGFDQDGNPGPQPQPQAASYGDPGPQQGDPGADYDDLPF